jgi:hypothetical protein
MPTTTTKTWSRQTAWVLMLGCVFLAANGQTEELAIVIWPVTMFALPAFGFRQPAVDSWMQRSQSSESSHGGRP